MALKGRRFGQGLTLGKRAANGIVRSQIGRTAQGVQTIDNSAIQITKGFLI
jgi:hypothetical protein